MLTCVHQNAQTSKHVVLGFARPTGRLPQLWPNFCFWPLWPAVKAGSWETTVFHEKPQYLVLISTQAPPEAGRVCRFRWWGKGFFLIFSNPSSKPFVIHVVSTNTRIASGIWSIMSTSHEARTSQKKTFERVVRTVQPVSRTCSPFFRYSFSKNVNKTYV